MDQEEKYLYYGIILACIVGICIASFVLLQTKPAKKEFSELYFYFERVNIQDGEATFEGVTIQVSTTIWIDINKNNTQDQGETFLKGDTFVLHNEFWHISDVAKDFSQILFGKFPKEVPPGDINFSFVIVNHVSTDYTYQYIITCNTVQGEKEPIHTKTQDIPIKKEEKKIISQFISIKEKGEYKITVTIDTGEEIYFYLLVQ
ncbi:MAG: hypothetical protein PVF58_09900 [Candidatus Methanofastidiosia archaeon]|jgi:hypothetical protein